MWNENVKGMAFSLMFQSFPDYNKVGTDQEKGSAFMRKEAETITGLEINGVIEKADGSSLVWSDFIQMSEVQNMSFGGMVKRIDLDNGREVTL